MFKSHRRLFWCTAFGIGIISPVFAVDLSALLSTSVTQQFVNQDSVTVGTYGMGNLYARNFRLVKQYEAKATQAAVQSIVDYYLRQSCVVSSNDILHVLYDSDIGFSSFL